jgi:ubiquinone/menaquinone biosynthesis C-methylase UbiE
MSERVGERTGQELTLLAGTAESLPYGQEEFDLVLATSVMEHTADPLRAVQEAYRVLRPGGGFYFWTTSILCPRQREITRFPAFSWYPDPVKKRIMNWAVRSRPALVGHTQTPALHWFSPGRARRLAEQAGFSGVYERWDLIRPDELTPARGRVLRLVSDRTVLRRAADVLIEGSSYLFVK